jgi:hypothetical protein
MRIGRRPLFFLGIAVTFLLMLIPTPSAFRPLNLAMAALALFWFVLLSIEELAATRRSSRRHTPRESPPSEGARS